MRRCMDNPFLRLSVVSLILLRNIILSLPFDTWKIVSGSTCCVHAATNAGRASEDHASMEISIIRGPTCLERCLGKSTQKPLAASSARGRKRRGCLCCRLYYRNGRRPVSRSARSRLYKRYHSPLRPNFDPLLRQEFWKRHRRERHKRRSAENRGLRADPGRIDISLR